MICNLIIDLPSSFYNYKTLTNVCLFFVFSATMDQIKLNNIKAGDGLQRIDEEAVVKSYVEERLSVRKIAKKYPSVSHSTVQRIIKKRLGNLRTWRLPGEK